MVQAAIRVHRHYTLCLKYATFFHNARLIRLISPDRMSLGTIKKRLKWDKISARDAAIQIIEGIWFE
jgi:hypothetical protein